MKDWILEKLGGMFGPKYIGATVRALLQALSGVLIAVGLPADDVANWSNATYPLAVGGVTWVITYVWSLTQKKNSIRLPPTKGY